LFRTGGVFSWFSDAAIDAKLDRINNFVSVEERRKFIASIFTDLYNQAPQIFLWSTSAIYGMSKKIDWTPSRNVSWPLLWNVKKQA
jgi:ABC-type transport system substrate-binding protein